MADDKLTFDTEINVDGFQKGTDKINKEFEKVGDGAEKAGEKTDGFFGKLTLKSLAGSYAVAKVGEAFLGGVKAGIEYNATIEQLETSFEVMTGSATEAKEIMEALSKAGAETPYETAGLAQTTQLLMNFGLAGQEAVDMTLMLGDAAQGNQEKLLGIASAYGKMASTGVASWGEIQMMIENGFNPLNDYADAIGKPRSEIMKLAQEGKISFEQLNEAIKISTSEGGTYFQSSAKQAETFFGLLSTLGDNAGIVLGNLTSGLFENMKTGANGLIGILDQLNSAFAEGGLAQMGEVAGQIMTSLLNSFTQNAPMLISQGIQIVGNLLNGLIQALPMILAFGLQMIMAIAQGLFQNIGQIVVVAAQLINSFTNALMTMLPMILLFGLQLIWELAKGLIQAIPTLIANAGTIVQAIFNVFTLANFFGFAKNLMVMFANGVKNQAPSIRAKALEIAKGMLTKFKSINWLQLGKDIINFIKNGLSSLASSIWSTATNIAKTISTKFTSVDWWGVGTKIVKAIGDGLSSMAGWLLNKALDLAKSAVEAAKNAVSSLFGGGGGGSSGGGSGRMASAPTPARASVMALSDESITNGIDGLMNATAPLVGGRANGTATSKLFGNNVTNNTTYNQTVNFNKPVQTPVEIARTLRRNTVYGLEG